MVLCELSDRRDLNGEMATATGWIGGDRQRFEVIVHKTLEKLALRPMKIRKVSKAEAVRYNIYVHIDSNRCS